MRHGKKEETAMSKKSFSHGKKKSFSHVKKIGHVGGVPNKLGSGVPL